MARPLPLSPRFLLVCIASCGTLAATAQDFAPLDAGTRKLFSTLPGYGPTFSLAIDSAVAEGDITHYYNFFAPADTWVPSQCPWWGGPECMPLTKPTWAGPRIDLDLGGVYTFHNVWGQPITVPFTTDPDAPAIIYSDATQRFWMDYEGTAPGADVLGQADDLRHYTLLHEDLDGVPIASALNGASVDVGATLGLVRFFRIDSFPQVLTPLELVGDANAQLGLYQLTPALINDHQVGDMVQWHELGHASMGPPSANFDRYRKHVFLERTEDLENVYYTVEETVYDVGAQSTAVATVHLIHSRTDVVATIPFERFNGTQPSLTMVDHCGLGLWHYRMPYDQGIAYCPEERCWGPYDTGGPPPMGHIEPMVGLGDQNSGQVIHPISGSTSGSSTIVYFVKDGTACGNEVVMGIGDVGASAPAVRVSPMPTTGPLTLEADHGLRGLLLYDLAGTRVLERPLSGLRIQVDVGALRAGTYVAAITLADGRQVRTRVVVH